MFNDLNNPANQDAQAVDDIFAETDKAAASAAATNSSAQPAMPKAVGGAEISTQKIGLAATDELAESGADKKSKDRMFKIIIIIIAIVVLGLGGYLVYSKFLAAPVAMEPGTPVTTGTPKPADTATPTPSAGSVVEPVGSTAATSTLDTSGTPATSSAIVVPTPTAPIDSDSDGLSDAEEIAIGTNINIIDTDNDGLSDYEEVNIYKSNPLSADTDGDGYLDGDEVKSGYDPNVVGAKLGGTASTSTSSPVIN